MNKSEDGNGPGQGMSAGYEITDGHCVSPPGNPTKGKDLEEDRRDEDGDHWQYIIWQRIVQDKQMYENLNQGLKINKSKRNVMMENDTHYMSTQLRLNNFQSYVYMG